ncbi:hypothetical protein FOXYSP1_05075 [Fusarium oxysporum f. sp. phaseoli]
MNRIDLCLYSESRRRQYGVVESGSNAASFSGFVWTNGSVPPAAWGKTEHSTSPMHYKLS